ncbi:hypothetical protein LSTR_LSTR002785 [Laodelphax striatellus]|uniref:Uncharacterized protein n=1 Tax=Laodelphax striatellus TaxID=195883 RepID=A0A482XHT7_LAOST|nr:hypothetical protein LSTR_LSTR002785 [Laodelphax striatellus]
METNLYFKALRDHGDNSDDNIEEDDNMLIGDTSSDEYLPDENHSEDSNTVKKLKPLPKNENFQRKSSQKLKIKRKVINPSTPQLLDEDDTQEKCCEGNDKDGSKYSADDILTLIENGNISEFEDDEGDEEDDNFLTSSREPFPDSDPPPPEEEEDDEEEATSILTHQSSITNPDSSLPAEPIARPSRQPDEPIAGDVERMSTSSESDIEMEHSSDNYMPNTDDEETDSDDYVPGTDEEDTSSSAIQNIRRKSSGCTSLEISESSSLEVLEVIRDGVEDFCYKVFRYGLSYFCIEI